MEPNQIFDGLLDAMHYAGRNHLRERSDEEIRAFMDWNDGNAWMQEIAEEELASREAN